MQATLAELSRTESLCDETVCQSADEVQTSGDRISSRGLEILRILNEVFNGLPTEMSAGTRDRQSPRE
jgi:hypothetical protein